MRLISSYQHNYNRNDIFLFVKKLRQFYWNECIISFPFSFSRNISACLNSQMLKWELFYQYKLCHWNDFLYVHHDYKKAAEGRPAYKHKCIFSSLPAETKTSLWFVEIVTWVLIEQQMTSEWTFSPFMSNVVWLNSKPHKESVKRPTPPSLCLQENLQPAFCVIQHISSMILLYPLEPYFKYYFDSTQLTH